MVVRYNNRIYLTSEDDRLLEDDNLYSYEFKGGIGNYTIARYINAVAHCKGMYSEVSPYVKGFIQMI